jgi:hypothetical protein
MGRILKNAIAKQNRIRTKKENKEQDEMIKSIGEEPIGLLERLLTLGDK